jgi:NAD(P)-dependent dehydrogenase (short-subunit alcohol dehydrogenase family)
MSDRETEHLRVLIANERKHRLALVVAIVAALGHEGFTETEMLEAVPDKALEKIRAQIPLRRLGRPEEGARVVHFLAADASSYITGQV